MTAFTDYKGRTWNKTNLNALIKAIEKRIRSDDELLYFFGK